MNREKQIKLARTVGAGLAFVAATALATPGWGRESQQERERGDLGPAVQVARMIGRELDLSREQKQALREIVRQHGDELRGATHQVGEARRALREKVLAAPLDEAAIRSASERLGASIGAAAVLTARLADEVRPILTPAQRERLQQMRERREERRERRSEHRGWHRRDRERTEIREGN